MRFEKYQSASAHPLPPDLAHTIENKAGDTYGGIGFLLLFLTHVYHRLGLLEAGLQFANLHL